MTTKNTLPSPPAGLRWAQIAPSGTWTPSARDAHEDSILADREWNKARIEEGHGPDPFGPPPASGVGCCVLVSGVNPAQAAPAGPGPAMTWGGRDLYILRDGAIYAAVPKGRPSVFAGEMKGIRLTGAFRLISAPRPGADYDRDVSRVMVVGAVGPVPARRLQAMDLAGALARCGYTDPAVFAGGAIVAVPAHLGGRE